VRDVAPYFQSPTPHNGRLAIRRGYDIHVRANRVSGGGKDPKTRDSIDTFLGGFQPYILFRLFAKTFPLHTHGFPSIMKPTTGDDECTQ
jgi:hypothetical protein